MGKSKLSYQDRRMPMKNYQGLRWLMKTVGWIRTLRMLDEEPLLQDLYL